MPIRCIKNISDEGYSNSIRTIRYVIGTDAVQEGPDIIPANARILDCWVEIKTPYSAGTGISVGYVGSITKIQEITNNNPKAIEIYSKEQDTAWDTVDRVVQTTVSNNPIVGAGVIVVIFCEPTS